MTAIGPGFVMPSPPYPSLVDYERQLRKIPPAARADLLRVLESDSRVLADVIRQFYERPGGREMADVLIDLEQDELIKFQVVAMLRELDGPQ